MQNLLDILAPRVISQHQKYNAPVESFVLPHWDHAFFQEPPLPLPRTDTVAIPHNEDVAHHESKDVVHIVIKVLKSTQTYMLMLDVNDTGGKLKRNVAMTSGRAVDSFRLVRKGKAVSEDQTLHEMGINVNSKETPERIQLVEKPSVSKKHATVSESSGMATPPEAVLTKMENKEKHVLSASLKRQICTEVFWDELEEHLKSALGSDASKEDVALLIQEFRKSVNALV